MCRRAGWGVVGLLAGIAIFTEALAHGPPDVYADYICVGLVKYKAPKLKVGDSQLLTGVTFQFSLSDQCTFSLGPSIPILGCIRSAQPVKNEMSAKYDLAFPDVMRMDVEEFLIQEIKDAYAARGETLDDITLQMDLEKSKGSLSFKRKPTPIGPVDSVKVKLVLYYDVTTVVGGVSETSKMGLGLKGSGISAGSPD